MRAKHSAQKAVIALDEPYRVRKQIRLPDYDYSTEGVYFITICSHEKKCIFSRVVQGDVFTSACVKLSPLGQIIEANLKLIPLVYRSVTVLNSCIMPNHIHLLLKVKPDVCYAADRSKMLVSKLIQSFKASVTKKAAPKYECVWQSRFYDHVVRGEYDLVRIWQYIDSNPSKWVDDCYYYADNDR